MKDIINLLRENDPELQIMLSNLLMCSRNKIWWVTVLRRSLEKRVIYVNTICIGSAELVPFCILSYNDAQHSNKRFIEKSCWATVLRNV
jgi:hypothetical protein